MKLKHIGVSALAAVLALACGVTLLGASHGEREKTVTLPESGEVRRVYSGAGATAATVTFTLTRGPEEVQVGIYQFDDEGQPLRETSDNLEPSESATILLNPDREFYIDARVLRGETGRATFQITCR